MSNILISGLVNTETTVRVRQFPINYYPIDYPVFGVSTAVSGVVYNIAKALRTLDNRGVLASMTGTVFRRRIQGLCHRGGSRNPVRKVLLIERKAINRSCPVRTAPFPLSAQ